MSRSGGHFSVCDQMAILGDCTSLTPPCSLSQQRLLEIYSELAAPQQAAAYQQCYTAALNNERRQVVISPSVNSVGLMLRVTRALNNLVCFVVCKSCACEAKVLSR